MSRTKKAKPRDFLVLLFIYHNKMATAESAAAIEILSRFDSDASSLLSVLADQYIPQEIFGLEHLRSKSDLAVLQLSVHQGMAH